MKPGKTITSHNEATKRIAAKIDLKLSYAAPTMRIKRNESRSPAEEDVAFHLDYICSLDLC
jgi:hypothetical protein